MAGLVQASEIAFEGVGLDTHPPGTLERIVQRAAHPRGPLGLWRTIRDVASTTDMLCQTLPEALLRIGAEVVIADQMEAAGGLVAEYLGLPYVSLACALPINRDPLVPLPFLPWGYDASERGIKRNRGGERVSDILMRAHARVILHHARNFGLAPRTSLADCLSPYAQISQTVAGFDFPRRSLPAHFHHVGPLRLPGSDTSPLELALDPQRPFIFASLGTLQGGRMAVFKAIAKACQALDVQLLIAHCGLLDARQVRTLESDGATWVTDFAPQRAVLSRATLAITHAGINTALDALSCGVPMLALPIAFDQPGVAARIEHAGAGERLSPRRLSAAKVKETLERLLGDNRYRLSARALSEEIRHAGGVTRAADIVEAAVQAAPLSTPLPRIEHG